MMYYCFIEDISSRNALAQNISPLLFLSLFIHSFAPKRSPSLPRIEDDIWTRTSLAHVSVLKGQHRVNSFPPIAQAWTWDQIY